MSADYLHSFEVMTWKKYSFITKRDCIIDNFLSRASQFQEYPVYLLFENHSHII